MNFLPFSQPKDNNLNLSNNRGIRVTTLLLSFHTTQAQRNQISQIFTLKIYFLLLLRSV